MSASSLAEYLPHAQVQMVHTVHTGERVNGIDPKIPIAQAKRLADVSRGLFTGASSVVHLIDPKTVPAIDESALAEALNTLPRHAADKLARAGNGKGQTLAYIVGHLLMHDTDLELTPLDHGEAEPIAPNIIISIGAQSERSFYEARMACKGAGVEVPGMLQETGQLFTRHVLPPYFMCREGEPPIAETHRLAESTLGDMSQNPSVQRDLQYVLYFLENRGGLPHA